MPRASIANITLEVRMGPFRHQFNYPVTPARMTEFNWFALLKTIKDAMIFHFDRAPGDIDRAAAQTDMDLDARSMTVAERNAEFGTTHKA